jgi:hypothetical protein
VKTVRTKTQRLSYQAVMVALSVVLTRVAGFRLAIGGIEGVRLGLGPLPLIMSGVLWGPAAGFFVGIVADIVGHVLSPMGSYMPRDREVGWGNFCRPANYVFDFSSLFPLHPGGYVMAAAFCSSTPGVSHSCSHLYFLDSLPCESNPCIY